MPRKAPPVPKLSHHKATGRAYVRLEGGRRVYLGRWNTPEAAEAYARFIREMAVTHSATPPPPDIRVAELAERFIAHVEAYGGDVDRTNAAARAVVELYGMVPARDFGPRALGAVQLLLASRGHVRSSVNRLTGEVKRMFRWGGALELIPGSVYHDLACVEGLRRGRSHGAPESVPRTPARESDVMAVVDAAPWPVRGLLLLQWHTGARSGEIVGLRRGDIDISVDPWRVEILDHKTAHHGKQRVLFVGPKGQAALRPYMMRKGADEFLFAPKDAVRAGEVGRRPDQKPNPRKTERRVRERYDTETYGRAIARVCEQLTACVDAFQTFTPHQVRHAVATRVRAAMGLEAAQAVLGHSHADVTQIYAQLSADRAAEIAAKLG